MPQRKKFMNDLKWQFQQKTWSKISTFYLPRMANGGSIGFVSRKMKKINPDFHDLGLFMETKDLSEKKISVCHAPGTLPMDAKFVAYSLDHKT
jgi:hypothetical protein